MSEDVNWQKYSINITFFVSHQSGNHLYFLYVIEIQSFLPNSEKLHCPILSISTVNGQWRRHLSFLFCDVTLLNLENDAWTWVFWKIYLNCAAYWSVLWLSDQGIICLNSFGCFDFMSENSLTPVIQYTQ